VLKEQKGGPATTYHAVWDEFDKGIIDASLKQWRRRLCACVAANVGQFEHEL